MKSRLAAPVLIALALLAGPSLVGCSLIQNPVEGIIEGATGEEVELPGTEIPEGFPKEVPVTDGEVVFGAAIGTGFSVSVRVDGPEAIDTITDELEAAGFEKQLGGTTGESASQAFSSAQFTVLVTIAKEGETGFIANYVVAPAGE